MPRRRLPRRRGSTGPPPRDDAGAPAGGFAQVEDHPDGDWVVRAVTGAAATRAYRCPGCDHEIRPATPHVVVWPADRGDAGLDDRRHWHTPCWRARDRRRR